MPAGAELLYAFVLVFHVVVYGVVAYVLVRR